jgi:hypothetical protein
MRRSGGRGPGEIWLAVTKHDGVQAADNGWDNELTYVCQVVHALMHENDCSIG